MDTPKLPPYGSKVRCINNQDRPELTVGAIYVVVHDPDLGVIPEMINPKRWYPDNFLWVAIRIPGEKENGIYPMGIFQVVS